MSVNRSRIGRSLSPGNRGLLDLLSPTRQPSDQIMRPPHPIVFTLGSPQSDDLIDKRTGAFLEACFLCKKRISDQDDVFMYSNFCAFCSPECRDEQIARDERQKPACSRS